MKHIIRITLAAIVMYSKLYAAERPLSFDKFYKASMKITPGTFTIYQDNDKYYMEIPAQILEKDVLVIGDITQGYSSLIAPSSGVIKFSQGDSSHLNIIRQEYKEAVSPSYNQEMEPLVRLSNLVPVSFVVKIEAYGKAPGSVIIDLSRQLREGGQFFSFRDFNALSRPDPERSGVQTIKAANDAVTFTVLRTQTDQSTQGGGKKMEIASAFLLHLTFQLLHDEQMQGRESDPRIGFSTVAFNDFGKSPYSVKNVKLIRKWNLSVKPADTTAYQNGVLVAPANPITVYIDRNMPSLFVPYVEQAIRQWEKAFAAAGFRNVFQISRNEEDNRLLYGKLLIKWGSVYNNADQSVIADPRSGEILAAKLTISEHLADNLLPWYFVACGLKDQRVISNFNNLQVKGELLEWVTANAMGELLGMENNYSGSNAFSTSQLRNTSWVKTHGLTSSVTDAIPFNYVAQPADQLPVNTLIAHVGAYDSLAIGWAYKCFRNEQETKQYLSNISYSNTALRYVPQENNDPFTQRLDLAADAVNASTLGIKHIATLYPQLESITAAMPGGDQDWALFDELSKAMLKTYDGYLKNVLWHIGGQSERPVLRNYNDTPVVYVSKKEQQQAFNFLEQYLFNGVPAFMKNKRAIRLKGETMDEAFQRMADAIIARLLNTDVLASLVAAENTMGNKAFTAAELFTLLDKTVFYNFSTTIIPDAHHVSLQRSMVSQLIQAVSKNAITSGLNGANEVLHVYFVHTLKNIDRMSKTHTDSTTRTRYQLLKQDIEKEYLMKPL
ncbi:zinc-dependent metalloprotease [Filimonas effusa]|uniref:DUF5117 domain-containing protein n=1 Tax=Filimonas effusa TaxID=2508721 RepID=A0A4Q1DC61_9BACT|nr:zinc-dependent metalloprotease [Filimonas effusa]RXK87071.1 DUF5117 domain-containing protein [Filimonas effusa]